MKSLPITARKRVASGKGGARQTRAKGGIPVIIYGEQSEAASLEINAHEFALILGKSTSEHILIDLTIEGGDGGTNLALVKEVQHDPVSEDVIHIDLLHIHATKIIQVTVPVLLTGLADGVKNFGGVLQQILRDVQAEGLPADLPDQFVIDVTSLNIHDAIHVSDLSAERVTLVTPAERTIATVVPPTVVKEVEEGEDAEVAEGAEAAEGEDGAEKKDDAAAEGDKDKKDK
jgi:large subunit ribosomal protein L25